jgi:DNA replicative helicase MCM subunit Mcm2 (Cdc46/Mcm family)
LGKHEDDDLVEALNEIFSTFQYDPAAIIQSLSIVLHGYLVEVKRKKSKKVCLIIENFPLSDINKVKAQVIDHFITFESIVLKVYQIRLMAVSLEF